MPKGLYPDEITLPNIIVFEGLHDEAFFRSLLRERQLEHFHTTCPGDPITTAGGRAAFSEFLLGLRTIHGFNPNVKNIILVSDNDSDPDRSFREVKKQVRQTGRYPIPNQPLKTANSGSEPDVTILMLPWENEKGTMETLCLRAARDQNSEKLGCVDTFGTCVGTPSWQIGERDKFRMRCFLGSLTPAQPNISLGRALASSNPPISLGHSCFDQVVSFLTQFETSP